MAGVTFKQSYRGTRGETIKGDLITIEGDLDGDFNFEGKVIVLGSILPGANIKGKGDLEVRGNIGENAQVVVSSLGVANGIGLFQVGGTVQKSAKVFADFIKLNKVDAAQVVSYKSATIGEVLPDSRIYAKDGNVVVRSNLGDRSSITCIYGIVEAESMGENVSIKVGKGRVDIGKGGISESATIDVDDGEVNSPEIRGNPIIKAPSIYTKKFDKNAPFADKVNRPPSLPPSFGIEKPKTTHAAPRPEDETASITPSMPTSSSSASSSNYGNTDSLPLEKFKNYKTQFTEARNSSQESQPIDLDRVFNKALENYNAFNDAVRSGQDPKADVTRGHPKVGLMTKWRHTEKEKARLEGVEQDFKGYDLNSKINYLRELLLVNESKSPKESNTHSFVNYLIDELLRCTNTPSFSIANYTQQQRQQIFDSLLEKLGPNSDPENNKTPRMG